MLAVDPNRPPLAGCVVDVFPNIDMSRARTAGGTSTSGRLICRETYVARLHVLNLSHAKECLDL